MKNTSDVTNHYPIVSFLMPSRGRKNYLEISLKSILETAYNSNSFEVIVCLDDDDAESIEWARDNANIYNLIVIISPRFGYDRLQEYYNLAAQKSNGKWLWLWNDDAIITTKNWDLILEQYRERFLLINPRTTNGRWNKYTTWGTIFPIVPRLWVDILGHYSKWNHNDTYIFKVAMALNIFKNEPRIKNIHYRIDDATTSQITYMKVAFPDDDFINDVNQIKSYLGIKKCIINRVKLLPFSIVRRCVILKDIFLNLLKKYI
jgi:glycosyltransferase involved in cell wall biosynthesis